SPSSRTRAETRRRVARRVSRRSRRLSMSGPLLVEQLAELGGGALAGDLPAGQVIEEGVGLAPAPHGGDVVDRAGQPGGGPSEEGQAAAAGSGAGQAGAGLEQAGERLVDLG